MNTVNDANIASALNFDPLDHAEKLTGESYKTDKLTEMLGFGLMLESNREKNAMLAATGDTHFSSKYADAVAIAESEGFKVVLSETFQSHRSNDDGTRRDESYKLLWHPDGLLLTLESYGDSVNTAKLYFNVDTHGTHNALYARGVRASGHFNIDKDAGKSVWVGDVDVRDGLRFTVRQLRGAGTLLPKWDEAPFLWFLTYMDTKDADGRSLEHGEYDYKAITAQRIAKLPQEVQDMIPMKG